MTTSTILIITILAVLLLVSLAVVTGAIALLFAHDRPEAGPGSDFQRLMKLLDWQWSIERGVYRHHRLFGLAIVLAALFCLWQLRAASPHLPSGSFWPGLLFVLAAAQLLNLVIGALVFFRPSLLKPIESVGNAWHRLDFPRRREPGTQRLRIALLALIGLLVLFGSAGLMFELLAHRLT